MKAACPGGFDFGKGRMRPQDLHEKRAGHHGMLEPSGDPVVAINCIGIATEEECLAEKDGKVHIGHGGIIAISKDHDQIVISPPLNIPAIASPVKVGHAVKFHPLSR